MLQPVRQVEVVLRAQHVQEVVGSLYDAPQDDSTRQFRDRKDLLVDDVDDVLFAAFLHLHPFDLQLLIFLLLLLVKMFLIQGRLLPALDY